MTLQTQNLVMFGLGVSGDAPPNSEQPPLVDGVHLRWAFPPERGFPLHCFYLFRRQHREGSPLFLRGVTGGLKTGPLPVNTLSTPLGEISSDTNLVLTDDFPPTSVVEFDLQNRDYLRLTLPEGDPARRVEVRLGFRISTTSQLRLTALLGDVPVAGATIEGQAGQIVTTSLEFDAISAVEIEGGLAALVDLGLVPVFQDATQGWEKIPGFAYPMRLPVTHPDYPCTPGRQEDLSAAQALARDRVHYGDPDNFTALPGETHTAGTVSVVQGSPVVIGSGTGWSPDLAGGILRVDGEA